MINSNDEEIRHLVWDWNGTLLDDLDLSISIINELLAEHQLPTVDKAQYLEVFDFPVIDYYRRLGFDFDRVSFEVVGAEFIRRYELRRTEAPLHQSVQSTLQTLFDRGFSQSILSAYRQDSLESFLAHFGIRDYFDDIIGSDNVYAHGKIEQGRAWMRERGADPETTLLIGDTRHDLEVANAMNCRCLLIANGHHPRHRLTSLGVPVVNTLPEALAWIT